MGGFLGGSSSYEIGDHQLYTATQIDFGSKKRFQRGWCTNCQNLREQQNVNHPQDCTGDVYHSFVGVVRGLWGSNENRDNPQGQISGSLKRDRISTRANADKHEQTQNQRITPWHEIIAKIIPWELFFVILGGICTLKISRKDGLFREITREIRNFSKIIISK